MRIAKLAIVAVTVGCASSKSAAPAATPQGATPVARQSATAPLKSTDASVPPYLDPRASMPDLPANNISVTMPGAIDELWRAVRIAYDSLGMPLNVYDERQHLIGNQGMKVRSKLAGTRLSRYFDCGSTQIGLSADSYDVLLAHVSYVGVAKDGSPMLATRAAAAARPPAFSQDYVRCFPTGELDKRFFALVRAAMREPH